MPLESGSELLELAPGSTLYTRFADSKAAAALIRPDFTVLRAGHDVAALREAASTITVARGTRPPTR